MGVTAGASYTDNTFLTISPNEIDDIVWRVSPYLTVSHITPNFDANLNYRLYWFRFADLKRTTNYHTGVGSLTGKFWQNALNLEVGARRSQVLSNPTQAIPAGRLQLGSNLADRNEIYANPRLNKPLGRSTSLIADYRITERSYADSLIQEDTNHLGILELNNYRAGQGLTWALRYNWRRSEFEISAPWEYQTVGAELGFWTNAKTRLFASGGKESDILQPFDPALEDTFWEVGVAHNAGENLNFELAAGERTFGTSWRGNIAYTFRRGNTTFTYTETPTTPGLGLARNRSIFDIDGITDFVNQPGSAQRFLSSRLQWGLNLNFRRTGLALTVFDEDRSDRITPTGLPLDDQSQRGAKLNFTWRAGARTTFGANGSIVRREIDSANKSELSTAGFSVEYQLGARSSVALAYSYNEAEPLGLAVNNQNYVANVVSLLFTVTN
ncbi:MAG: hypothetical protein AAFN50_01250 [Pseudomonadota bacterium]